ncbi:MAG TPA: protein kinase [Bryobacteraceae bacterium]|nr:protein kinase [Bryobacteraceae bacterium]
MTPERWAWIKEMVGAAIERPEQERNAWLDSACGADNQLRAEVERLLAQGEETLKAPAADFLAGTLHGLAAGDVLLHYRIEAKIGEGGMGVVYRAYDTRLHRVVALKTLPREMALDPGYLQRFRREARAVAALNHPNVVTLYDVDQADGIHFLTMELVAGKTLAQLIPQRGFPVPEFLRIAVPLADAIGAAHQSGVVHRDLKPANVIVGAEGRPKVLDFGLAKLKRAEALVPAGETETQRELTAPHHIMGTVPYMSPEQLEGRPVDARSDIFSLGVMFYEMATGTRPFRGDSTMSIVSSILKDSPPALAEVNPAIPNGLDRIVRRCLAKDPARRYQSAADLRNDLEELQQQVDSGEAPDPKRGRSMLRRFALVAAGVFIAVAGYETWRVRQEGSSGPALAHAEFLQLTSQPGVEWFPSLSPDGKWLVYAGNGARGRQIYLQSVSGQNPINLSKDEAVDDDQPAFSPDGERIAFRSSREGGGIFVMGRTGEAARRVTHVGFRPSWSPDGTQLAFTTENVELNPQNVDTLGELWVVAVGTGEMRRLSQGDAVLASWSPHDRRIAYTHRLGNPAKAEIWTVPVAGGTPIRVIGDRATNWNPAWSPDGKYLYFASDRGGSTNLWRVLIDETSGKARGEPEPITTPAPYLAHPSLSADGKHIAYTSALVTANIQQLALDPSGSPKADAVWVTNGSRRWSDPDPSPEGEWLTFYSLVQPGGHLYVAHPDGTAMRQLTTDSAIDRLPRWSPDGKWIACFSDRSGHLELWKVRPDGSDLQQLTEGGAGYLAWSPDGSRIATVGAIIEPMTKWRGWIIDPNRPWKQQTPEVLPQPDLTSSQHFLVNSWSPDGERLAGSADPPAQGIVMYSMLSRKYERITGFGEWPVWLPDSRSVLFVAGGKAFFVADTRSKQVRKVFSVTRDTIGPPGLTRDGKTAYFSRRVTEADIWLLTMK